MIRAPLGDSEYWDEWVSFRKSRVAKDWVAISQVSANPVYDPQYMFDSVLNHLRLLVSCYSSGENVRDLNQYLSGILDAWELSNSLSEKICKEFGLNNCRDWIFDLSDLNHYILCFWLIGLALTLDAPEDQWVRLLLLVGGEGRDALLDSVIASRQPGRSVGSEILHKKPYSRLLEAVSASKERQPRLLRDFVDHWYPELNRSGKNQPWWYVYGDPEKHPLKNGSYFGRWCIEAAVCAKVFNIDDSACLDHDYYPGDLLRPGGPSTHVPRVELKKRKWLGIFRR